MGSPYDDLIAGSGDIICGDNGDDFLLGGTGNDTLYGQNGREHRVRRRR